MTPILPRVIYLYPNNTQVINIIGLTDVTTGFYLDSAAVFATLYDQYQNPDPVLNDIELFYVLGSNGNYQGTVPASFSPAAFTGASPLGGYTLQISAEQASVQALFTIPVIVQLRSQQ
jgi:hypothetical protein